MIQITLSDCPVLSVIYYSANAYYVTSQFYSVVFYWHIADNHLNGTALCGTPEERPPIETASSWKFISELFLNLEHVLH